MSEDVARAVGAHGPTVTIHGKEYAVRPLTVRELAEVERDCLERYKRQHLKTFIDNADMMPEDVRVSVMRDKLEEAAKWDVGDLPRKYAYDGDSLTLTHALKAWVHKRYGLEGDPPENGKTDLKYRALATAALDSEMLPESLYKELTGATPHKAKIGYVNWWITGSYDGMISFVHAAFKAYGLSRDDVATMPLDVLAQAAKGVEQLTAPAVGNG